MKRSNKLNFAVKALPLAIALAGSTLVNAATTLSVDANTRQYVNLDNGQVQSSSFYGWDLYIEREAIVLRDNTESAYLNTTDFANASTAGADLKPTQGYSNTYAGNFRFYKPSIHEWNRNWFGKSIAYFGFDGLNMSWLTKPFGGLYSPNFVITDANGKDMVDSNLNGGSDKLSHGLFYPRRENVNQNYSASNDKKDFIAIPQNQLIVRTSKGNKFVRLRAIQSFDYVDANGSTINNTRSNNIYFKYAVQDLAAGDNSFGPERDMCVSFTTGAKEPKYKQYETITKDSPWSRGVGIFKYGFMHSDGYYKQAFIDFDKIIQGPGNSVVDFNGNTTNLTGNSYPVKGKDGSINTYPEVANYNTTPATRMYSEGCMPAFWGDRQANRYPAEYLNGFGVKGADTPLHNRRADWLIDNPDATQTSYNGQDEWDIAIGVLVRYKTFGELFTQRGIVYSSIIANSGRTGDNTNGELRNKGGLAAMTLVEGTGLNNYSPTDALNTHTNASEAGNFVPVQSINDPRVAGKWQATGRSMVERYNHINVDANGVSTNGRVYAIKTANGTVRKLQVSNLIFNDTTADYTITYE